MVRIVLATKYILCHLYRFPLNMIHMFHLVSIFSRCYKISVPVRPSVWLHIHNSCQSLLTFHSILLLCATFLISQKGSSQNMNNMIEMYSIFAVLFLHILNACVFKSFKWVTSNSLVREMSDFCHVLFYDWQQELMVYLKKNVCASHSFLDCETVFKIT